MDGIVSVPNFSGFFAGAYSPRVPSLTVFKNSVRDGPRYVDMTAGGASMAPRRKSLPGDAIARRIKSPCLSMAETMADMTSGKISGLPVTELTCFGFIKLRPSEVPMDQLLCLPEPLMPANGFSWRSPARPCSEATSSMICIIIKFWSTWLMALPNIGANSYWFGATSR